MNGAESEWKRESENNEKNYFLNNFVMFDVLCTHLCGEKFFFFIAFFSRFVF